MKKILSIFLLTFLSLGLTFGQNNSTGGSNFYQISGLYGTTLPALSGSGGAALVYVDDANSDDKVVSELSGMGFIVTIATGSADFNSKISSGVWDLVVLFNQNYDFGSQGYNLTAVQNYINSGGSMIFTSWDILDAEAWANVFRAHYTGNENNPTVTITDPILANGISNPVTLTNEGWGTFSMGLSALSGGEVLATFSNGDAAIIRGNNGRTIMLGYLSDAPSSAVRGILFSNIVEATGANPVPIPYWWIVALFVAIAIGVVITRRKVIFS